MANRHLARSTVLQALYEWDFGGQDNSKAPDILERTAREFAPDINDGGFMTSLMKGVMAKRADLDKIIEKAAPDWPIDKISVIDRNILRVGLYELLFASRAEVPAKVAINEAIELAKSYGGDTSSKFVNGVLGAVYKEIGEPGKNEASKRHKPDSLKVTFENLGGAVVFARHEGEIYLALVHDIFGHWTLSKGKIEQGEDVVAGTIREIQEELGLDITIKEKLDENEYTAFNPEAGKKRKHVSYFLAEADFKELIPEKKGGLDDAKWFKLKDILDLNFYNDILPIITKAINLIIEKYSS